MSAVRMISASTFRPERAAVIPRSAPRARERNVGTNAVIREIRIPWRMRLRTSRPMASVPIQCCAEGGWRNSL